MKSLRTRYQIDRIFWWVAILIVVRMWFQNSIWMLTKDNLKAVKIDIAIDRSLLLTSDLGIYISSLSVLQLFLILSSYFDILLILPLGCSTTSPDRSNYDFAMTLLPVSYLNDSLFTSVVIKQLRVSCDPATTWYCSQQRLRPRKLCSATDI